MKSPTVKELPSSTKSQQPQAPGTSEPQTIEFEIFVDEDARLTFLYDDELSDLLECGDPERNRASHVEPFGTSEWTADMSPVGGPLLGPFPTRAIALAEEKVWLNKFLAR